MRMKLSLSGLLLLIAGFGVLLYAGLGAYTYYEVRALDQRIAQEHRLSATREVEESVRRALAQGNAELERLAAWEEVRQHLHAPDYYAYWRGERVPALELPAAVAGVELYNHRGQALDPGVSSPFTPQLRDRGGRPVLVREQGRDFVLLHRQVSEPGGRSLGFVVLAVDLAQALVPPGGLRYAAFDSRVTVLPESARVASSDIANKIRFSVQGNNAAAQVRPLIRTAYVNIVVATVLLLAVIYFGVAQLVARPLRQLAGHLNELADEDAQSSGLGAQFAVLELDTVRRSIDDYQSRLEVVHRGLDRKNRRLWKLAHHDPLTGCLNRRAFEDDWKHLLELAMKSPAAVSLILIDCNHFKAINDTYGHNVGDEVLKGIGNTLRRNLQRGDRLYRLASDEFAVIFVDAGREPALDVARMCLGSIEQHGFTHLGVREPVRISVGIAHSESGDPDDLKGLYRCANVAMFRAKRPGEPPLAVYTPDMEGSATVALSSRAASAVDRAVASGDNIQMHYQPVCRLSDRELVYFEALVRLRDGDGVIPPDEFFLQLEIRRLETDFDNAVFGALLRDLEAGAVPPGKGISINVSGASIVAEDIEARLQPFTRYLPRHELILEVTETTLISQLQLASERLARLRNEGFKVALDDFGSGYSSLRYLADMPVDVVKFDISLVHALCEDSPRARMLSKLVELLREPGYTLVAEGVESEAIAATVQALGFDLCQGYLLGHPQELRGKG